MRKCVAQALFAFSVIGGILGPRMADAQTSVLLQQGARVRITEQSTTRVGNIVSITPDSVKLVADRPPFAMSTYATTDIRRLDRSEGVSAVQGAARGGLLGLVAGVVGGIVVGKTVAGNDSMAAALSVMWGGLGGLMAGAFIGAARGMETWVTLGKPYL